MENIMHGLGRESINGPTGIDIDRPGEECIYGPGGAGINVEA